MLAVLLGLLGCGGGEDGACPTRFRDEDGDGFGDAAHATQNCFATSGYVAVAGDCDDGDDESWPGAPEGCEGLDRDCDGEEDPVVTWYLDEDGDGYGGRTGRRACEAPEGMVGNGDDCDDDDPDVGDTRLWYWDQDNDGYGASAPLYACDRPDGEWADQGGDCADDDYYRNPGARETCDLEDDDCDGEIDEGDDAWRAPSWYPDEDGDGWGAGSASTVACYRPPLHAAVGGDCDDADATSWPGAPEADCDDPVDHNCDGSAGREDDDGDGAVACEDCDDADESVGPHAVETCDEEDDDCDGEVDEDDAADATPWYLDEDSDGYGTVFERYACWGGPRLAAADGDCDDADDAVSPGDRERCDTEVDDDCDGDTNDPYAIGCVDRYPDVDGDGYGGEELCTCTATSPTSGTSPADCDDEDAAVNPDAAEACGDGVDQDCAGSPECGVADDLELVDAAMTIVGADDGDALGRSLASLDDLDGDGFDELVVGATGLDGSTGNLGGALVFASPLRAGVTEDDALAVLYGEGSGGSVLAAPGDVDGDALPDLLVGSPDDTSYTGLAYLVSGAALAGEGSLADHAAREGGAVSDYLGTALAGPGDVDGDGLADVFVGARGADAAYLWCGGFAGRQGATDATATITGTASDATGYAVAGGDLDGDGLGDLVVGAPYAGSTGEVSVWWGPVSGVIARADAAVTITHPSAGRGLGQALAVGDADGDGLPDVAAGASGWGATGSYQTGAVYLFASPLAAGSSDDAVARYLGENDEEAGEVLDLVDLDGDGREDVVSSNVFSSSSIYGARVWTAPHAGDLGDGAATVRGEHTDYLGQAFTGAPDVDGDGFDDLWLGARGGDDGVGGSRQGVAVLFVGGVGS